MKKIVFAAIILFVSCNLPITYPDKGFSYPKEIDAKDTNHYYYPLRDSISTKDSLVFKYRDQIFFDLFDEPNLSIKPSAKPVFRFIYTSTMDTAAVVTLTEDRIVVKRGIKGFAEPYSDTNKLNERERFDFKLLERFFPINESKRSDKLSQYLDSLTSIRPELLNPTYYVSLLKKSEYSDSSKFEYETKAIPISRRTYTYLVQLINDSEFWDVSYEFINCPGLVSDGYGFSIEANTSKKYKVVFVEGCPNDASKLTKACNELLKYAYLHDKISLLWDGKIDTSTVEPQEVELEDIKPPEKYDDKN